MNDKHNATILLRSVAERWRALCLAAVACLGAVSMPGLPGCSSTTGEQKIAPVAVESSAPSGARSPEKTSPATRQETLQPQAFGIQEFSVREESGQTILQLKLSTPISQYRHFPLAQPPRVLLDIFGDLRRTSEVESFRVGTNLVGTVRFSSNEGYLRISMEILSAAVPPYVVTPEDGGGVKIVVGAVDPKATGKREIGLVKGGKRMESGTSEVKPEGQTQASVKEETSGEEKKYTGQRLSFDFKDADIKNVFRLLAEVSGLNIIVTADVNRRVTLRLVDVPWDQALDLLIDTNGLAKEQIGNVVRISTAGQLKAERDALTATQKARENLEPLRTAYFNVNYAKVKDLEGKVKPLLSKRPEAALVIDERSNTIMVRDIKKSVDDVSTLVSKFDTRTPQILIESNLIETTPTFARALGAELNFTLGTRADFDSEFLAGAPFAGALTPAIPPVAITRPTSGVRFGIVQRKFGPFRDLNYVLTAAENEGTIKIISRPSVVTLNNVQSTIRSERILRIALPTSTNIASGTGSSAGAAVATERVPVGIILSVTPQVSSDGYVLMTISVRSSSIAPTATVSGGTAGVIPFDELNREAVANVLVKDGETIVIGGILKDTSATAQSGIPYLKDIPVLGWLFKNIRWQKDFEELMVFITPRISEAGSVNLPTAEQLWREKMNKTNAEQTSAPSMNP